MIDHKPNTPFVSLMCEVSITLPPFMHAAAAPSTPLPLPRTACQQSYSSPNIDQTTRDVARGASPPLIASASAAAGCLWALDCRCLPAFPSGATDMAQEGGGGRGEGSSPLDTTHEGDAPNE